MDIQRLSHHLILLCTFFLATLVAQGQSYEGTDFWVGFMENSPGDPTQHVLSIASRDGATGVVSIPLQGWSQEFEVGPEEVVDITVPFNLANHANVSSQILPRGVHVESTDKVVVYAGNYQSFTSDAATVMPTNALKTNYDIVSLLGLVGTLGGRPVFIVVATEDNTVCDVTVTGGADGQDAGTTKRVILNRGETYQVKASSQNNDLTGSKVETSKPVNIYTGNTCAVIGPAGVPCCCCDHLYEQMRPTETWGFEHYLAQTNKAAGSTDNILVYATEDNTIIRMNGVQTANLNAGQTIKQDLGSPLHISSTKPVHVSQYLKSSTCSGADAAALDPLMLDVLPIAQWGEQYIFSTSPFARYDPDRHFVTILMRTDDVETLRISEDGGPPQPLTGVNFTPVYLGDPNGISYGYYNAKPGTPYSIFSLTKKTFAIFVYGYGAEEAYGYTGGGNLYNLEGCPIMDFDFEEVCLGNETNFTDLTVEPRFDIIDWTWDFGDGNISKEQNPTHLFTEPGVYDVKLTVVNTAIPVCPPDQASITKKVAVYAQPSVDAGEDQTICGGDVAMLGGNPTITGGTPLYDITWDGPNLEDEKAANTEASPEEPTVIYSLKVVDANGCEASDEVTVTLNEEVLVTKSVTDIQCFGNTDGEIRLTRTSGKLPFTVNWSPSGPQDELVYENAPSGFYDVNITSADGCNLAIEVEVLQPEEGMSVNIETFEADCDAPNGVAEADVNGGTVPYTYQWSSPANADDDPVNEALNAGPHTLTVTDKNDCEIITDFFVAADANIEGYEIDTKGVDCFGDVTGIAELGIAQGFSPYEVEWVGPTTGSATIDDDEFSIDGLANGVYNFNIRDEAGCPTQIAGVEIEGPDAPLSVDPMITDITCFKADDGMVNLNIAGGTSKYDVEWSDGEEGEQRSGLIPGEHCYTIIDKNDCTLEGCITINEPAPMNFSLTAKNLDCNKNASGQVIVTIIDGGTPPFTINGIDAEYGQPFEDNDKDAGTYTYTITDGNNCAFDSIVSLTEPAALAINNITTAPAFCKEETGTAEANIVGGTSPIIMEWFYDNIPLGQNTNKIENRPGGDHLLRGTDNNDCIVEENILIPTSLGDVKATIDLVENPRCPTSLDGVINVSATGASDGSNNYSYEWYRDGNLIASTSANNSNFQAGNYTGFVYDNTGCVDSVTQILTPPNPVSPSANVTDVLCFNAQTGIIQVAVSGGQNPYRYEWSHDNALEINTASDLSAGNYSVEVFDANDCSVTLDLEVIQPDAPLSIMASNLVPVSCFGEATGAVDLTATGGTMPYTSITITDDSASTISTVNSGGPETIVDLLAGDYRAEALDNNGCVAITNFTITEPAAPLEAIGIEVIPANCQGETGTGRVDVSGGTPPYRYVWEDFTEEVAQQSNMTEGRTYNVNVADANGCLVLGVEVQMTNIFAISLSAAGITTVNAICDKPTGSLTAEPATGGTPPYTYVLRLDGQIVQSNATGDFPNMLVAGDYTIQAVDSKNCEGSRLPVTIDKDDELPIEIQPVKIVECGPLSSIVAVPAPSATPPISYNWSNNMTTEVIDNLAPGAYSVSFTDSDGCAGESQEFVINDVPLRINIQPSITLCFDEANGQATTTVTQGGYPPFDFNWSTDNGVLGQSVVEGNRGSLVDIPFGEYNVVVTDSEGCETSGTTYVENAEEIVIGTPTTINIQEGQFVEFNPVIVPNNDYIYLWSPEGLFSDAFGAAPIAKPSDSTEVILMVTNPNGCEQQVTIQINVEPYIEISIANAFIPGDSKGNGTFGDFNTAQYSVTNVRILNRWGNILHDGPEPWDGTLNGAKATVGTYAYIIEFTMHHNNQKVVKRGNIAVMF